jgi:hypothetical protein
MGDSEYRCDSSSCLEYLDNSATHGRCYITGQAVERWKSCTWDPENKKCAGRPRFNPVTHQQLPVLFYTVFILLFLAFSIYKSCRPPCCDILAMLEVI